VLYGLGVYDAPTPATVVLTLVFVTLSATTLPTLEIAKIDRPKHYARNRTVLAARNQTDYGKKLFPRFGACIQHVKFEQTRESPNSWVADTGERCTGPSALTQEIENPTSPTVSAPVVLHYFLRIRRCPRIFRRWYEWRQDKVFAEERAVSQHQVVTVMS
jgi:hypothetical protein